MVLDVVCVRKGQVIKMNKIHKRLSGYVRRCVEDYDMISDGETIAIGVSGGKDSLALLRILASLRMYYPKRFNLHAVTLDMGFGDADAFAPIAALCESLDVPFTLRKTNIARVVFDDRQENNPCSLCAKMRRGMLNDVIAELGIMKLALAHHYDDAIETFLLSLLYEGRIHCFQPVTYMDRRNTTQIRPMLYVEESSIIDYAKAYALPIVHNPCSMNGVSKREEVKALVKTLRLTYPDLKSKLFGSMQRLPIKGWQSLQ